MKLAGGGAVLAVIVVASLLMVEPSEAAASSSVGDLSSLYHCLNYVEWIGNTPPADCCYHFQNLNTRSPEDRQFLCEFIKDVAMRLSNILDPLLTWERVSQIPGLCHVNVIVPNKPDFDCSSIP